MTYLLIDIEQHIATLTFNHDAKRNALSEALLNELIAALEQCARQKVRVVILRAKATSKVWSAGHDISELPKGPHDPLSYDSCLEQALRAVKHFPAPIIALIQGSVWGGACDLALSCDMIIGDEHSCFAMTPANIGLPYNLSGVLQFMNRLPLNIMKEMFFTAKPINAELALQYGILNHLVTAKDIENYTQELALHITHKAPLSIAVVKEQTRILSDAAVVTPDMAERIQDLRRKVYQSQDYVEGIAAFFAKRSPDFKGQ